MILANIYFCQSGHFPKSDDSCVFVKLYSSKGKIVDYVAFHAVLILSASLSISACTRNQVKKVFLLFIFGPESSVISKIWKWWWWGGGATIGVYVASHSF